MFEMTDKTVVEIAKRSQDDDKYIVVDDAIVDIAESKSRLRIVFRYGDTCFAIWLH